MGIVRPVYQEGNEPATLPAGEQYFVETSQGRILKYMGDSNDNPVLMGGQEPPYDYFMGWGSLDGGEDFTNDQKVLEIVDGTINEGHEVWASDFYKVVFKWDASESGFALNVEHESAGDTWSATDTLNSQVLITAKEGNPDHKVVPADPMNSSIVGLSEPTGQMSYHIEIKRFL